MFLSSAQTRALGSVMRLTAEASDGTALRAALAVPMLTLLEADQYVSMVWDTQSERFTGFTSANVSQHSLRRWDQYFHTIDPLTVPMMKLRRPTVATQIMCQSNLQKTEFFNDFLVQERMHWGVNVYFFDRQECVGDFRIWRKHHRGNFEANDIELLRLVEPAITGALGRLHWLGHDAPSEQTSEMAEEVLQKVSGLSKREAEVAWLVACGCPDKLIARQLSMGHPTVRFHLANCFKKLQSENRTSLAKKVNDICRGESVQ